MADKEKLSCVDCGTRACGTRDEAKYPSFCMTERLDDALVDEVKDLYRNDEETNRISRESALIEGEFYGKMTRVEETLEFIKRMGYKKIGIATCGGLLEESKTFAKILRARGFEVVTACCKIGAIDKSFVGVPDDKKLNGGCGHESMCNPVMQAKVLAENKCDCIVSSACAWDTTHCSSNITKSPPPCWSQKTACSCIIRRPRSIWPRRATPVSKKNSAEGDRVPDFTKNHLKNMKYFLNMNAS